MTTVAQMIEWMKTLPPDAEVECGVEVTGGYSTWMEMRPVDIENSDVWPCRWSGKTIVTIRGE